MPRIFTLLNSQTCFNQKSDQFCDCSYGLYIYMQLFCISIISLTGVFGFYSVFSSAKKVHS